MIEFTDAGGDKVRTFVGTDAPYDGCLLIECVSGVYEDLAVPALLPSMARALAADLIAWADSVDVQEEG